VVNKVSRSVNYQPKGIEGDREAGPRFRVGPIFQTVILCVFDVVDGRCGSPRGQSRD
jgi:hypothetical protein